MNIEFDQDTADNPFEHRPPTLPKEATERERELAEKYTRISFLIVDGVEDASLPWLEVGVQSFPIGDYRSNREEASWMCWMLAKALAKVIDDEVKR